MTEVVAAAMMTFWEDPLLSVSSGEDGVSGAAVVVDGGVGGEGPVQSQNRHQSLTTVVFGQAGGKFGVAHPSMVYTTHNPIGEGPI